MIRTMFYIFGGIILLPFAIAFFPITILIFILFFIRRATTKNHRQVNFSTEIYIDQSAEPRKKTYIDSNGYRRFCDSNRLVHRWVVERYLYWTLGIYDEVHHIDGNKLNNSINNLWVCDREGHQKLHELNVQRYGQWHLPVHRKHEFVQEFINR